MYPDPSISPVFPETKYNWFSAFDDMFDINPGNIKSLIPSPFASGIAIGEPSFDVITKSPETEIY